MNTYVADAIFYVYGHAFGYVALLEAATISTGKPLPAMLLH